MKKTVQSFCLTLITSAGFLPVKAQSNFWIIGGQDAAEGQFPWVADFRRTLPDEAETHLCGAALIHPYWIITASHCIRVSTPAIGASRTIRLNSVNTWYELNPDGGLIAEIDTIYDNPRFSMVQQTGAGNDLALIRLKKPVHTITPISLPRQEDTSAPIYSGNRKVKAAGWGLIDTGGFAGASILNWVETKIIDHTLCQQYYAGNTVVGELSKGVICAGYDDSLSSGVGAGDSGGPLWTEEDGKLVLLGIVSGGGGWKTTLYKQPGIFTKIAYYRPWIDSIINEFTPRVDTPGKFDDQTILVSSGPDRINVAFKSMPSDKVTIQLYNIDGRRMYQTALMAPAHKTIHIDSRHFAAGIYVLRIYDNQQRTFTKKLHYIAY
ncbi:MAG: trypsin-like serine protease [Sphingobacteriales bacterium]|nr:MAG: trypsin-like serine protease [Sphingobacteriales bacterium]